MISTAPAQSQNSFSRRRNLCPLYFLQHYPFQLHRRKTKAVTFSRCNHGKHSESAVPRVRCLGGFENMRPVDVFAIAAAIVIALLSLIVEPWSGLWWIALLAATFVALWAFLHIASGGGAR